MSFFGSVQVFLSKEGKRPSYTATEYRPTAHETVIGLARRVRDYFRNRAKRKVKNQSVFAFSVVITAKHLRDELLPNEEQLHAEQFLNEFLEDWYAKVNGEGKEVQS